MKNIFFHSEDTTYVLKSKNTLRDWITASFKEEGYTLNCLNIIFCSDNYLLKVNQDYLNHDYFTDIITFQYSENQYVEGDLFVSVDNIKHNAKKYNVKLLNETHRVIIHGCLHLMGYKDKTPEEKELMRSKEDYYLSLLAV